MFGWLLEYIKVGTVMSNHPHTKTQHSGCTNRAHPALIRCSTATPGHPDKPRKQAEHDAHQRR